MTKLIKKMYYEICNIRTEIGDLLSNAESVKNDPYFNHHEKKSVINALYAKKYILEDQLAMFNIQHIESYVDLEIERSYKIKQ